MSKQMQLPSVAMIALGVFIVAFILLMLIGYGFLAALFFALVLALAVAIFFLLSRDRPSEAAKAPARERERSGHATDATRAVPAAGPKSASSETSDGPAPEGAPAAPLMSAPPQPEETTTPVSVEEKEPPRLEAARDGAPDDLKRIKGVGPKIEEQLNGMGFYHFDQIASWAPAEVAWMDEHLVDFRGRVSRDDWVGQARLLAGGGETDFSRRVDEGDVYD